jgi:hypothetical protein
MEESSAVSRHALIALNDGLMRAPALTSEGTAAALRFTVEYADYIVQMTPDPRRAPRRDRPIPAEGIREALRDEGYSVLRARRTRDGATHQVLADRSQIGRRRIGRICSGEINDLTEAEAEAILVAIGREDLIGELVDSYVRAAAAHELAIAEALEEIYELMWICERKTLASSDERLALHDLHLLYLLGQRSSAAIRLPFSVRRKGTTKWFCEAHGRQPHPVPEALRKRALAELVRRHDEALEQAAAARTQIGPPERINAAYARDLLHRARKRGLLDSDQRPLAFQPDRAAPKAHPSRLDKRAHACHHTRKRPLTIQARRLRQADRGIEREFAELRVLRTAPELERDDPRRIAYEARFHDLAVKSVRRAEFRKHQFIEIRSQQHGGLGLGS